MGRTAGDYDRWDGILTEGGEEALMGEVRILRRALHAMAARVDRQRLDPPSRDEQGVVDHFVSRERMARELRNG